MHMTSMPNLSDDDEFEADMDLSPVKAIKQCRDDYVRNESGHRENQWKLIQRAAIISRRLLESEGDSEKFLKEDFWKERSYKPNPKRMLLYCMQFLVGAPSSESPKYKTASDYAKAASLLLDEGCRTAQIFSQLKARGGPYNIIADNKEGDQVGRQGNQDEEGGLVDEPLGSEIDREKRAGTRAKATPSGPSVSASLANSGPPRATKKPSRGTKASRSAPIFREADHIALTGHEYQDRIRSMAVHERRWLQIERVENEGSILRFDVIGMRVELE